MKRLNELVEGRRVLCVLESDGQAVDFSTAPPQLLEQLKARPDDLGKLPFADESFDAVGLVDTYFTAQGRPDVIGECHRVLANDGTLIVLSSARETAAVDIPLELLRARFSAFDVNSGATNWTTKPGVESLEDASVGEYSLVAVARKHAAESAGLSLDSPVDLRPLDDVIKDQSEIIEKQRQQLAEQSKQMSEQAAQLEEQSSSLRAQAVLLDEQSELMKRQETYIVERASMLESHVSELARMRTKLLDAERQLAHMHELEGELAEALVISEELRNADRRADLIAAELADVKELRAQLEGERNEWFAAYEVVVGSTSWKVTGPLRTIMRRVRRRR